MRGLFVYLGWLEMLYWVLWWGEGASSGLHCSYIRFWFALSVGVCRGEDSD